MPPVVPFFVTAWRSGGGKNQHRFNRTDDRSGGGRPNQKKGGYNESGIQHRYA
jgi:hypothetical protein